MARVKDTRYVNPQDVYNYLVSEKGLSREHALGMLANIQAESGFNVSIQEKGKAYGSGGVGLFQHTGSRRSELMKYTGGDVSDWKKQINFALQENLSKAYLSKTFSTPEEASTWFTTQWERPANASSQAKLRLGNINKFSHFTQYESTGNDGVPTGERKFQIMLGDTPTYISLEDFNAELEKVKKAEEKTTKSEDRKEVEAAKTKEQSFLEAMNMLYSNSDQNTSPAGAEDQQMGAQGTGYEPIEVPQQQSSLPTLPSLFSTAMPEMVDGGPVKPPKWSLGYTPYAYNAGNVVGGYEKFGDLTSQNLQLSTPDLFGREKDLNATRFPFSISAGRMYDKNLTNDTTIYSEVRNYDYTYKTPQEILDSRETPYAEGIPLDAELSFGVEGSGINPNMKKRSKLGSQFEVGYNPTTGVYGQFNTEQKWALGNNYANPLNRPGEWRVEPYISPLNFQVSQKPATAGNASEITDKYLQELAASGSPYNPLEPNSPIISTDSGQVEGLHFVTTGAGVDAQVKLPIGMLDAGVGVNYNLQSAQGQKFSPTAHLSYKIGLDELGNKINLPEINLPERSPFRSMSAAGASGTRYDNSLFEEEPAPQESMGKVNASPINKRWQKEAEDIFIDFKNNSPGMVEYPPQEEEDPNTSMNFKFGGQVQKMVGGGEADSASAGPGNPFALKRGIENSNFYLSPFYTNSRGSAITPSYMLGFGTGVAKPSKGGWEFTGRVGQEYEGADPLLPPGNEAYNSSLFGVDQIGQANDFVKMISPQAADKNISFGFDAAYTGPKGLEGQRFTPIANLGFNRSKTGGAGVYGSFTGQFNFGKNAGRNGELKPGYATGSVGPYGGFNVGMSEAGFNYGVQGMLDWKPNILKNTPLSVYGEGYLGASATTGVSYGAELGLRAPMKQIKQLNLPELNLPSMSSLLDLGRKNEEGNSLEQEPYIPDGGIGWGEAGKVNASPIHKRWQPTAEDIFINFKNNPVGMIEYPPQEDPNNPTNFKFGGQVQKMPDGGSVYTYAERPGSYYQKTNNGKWLISNDGTGGKYVPVQDPTGERSAALNKGATMIMANPTQDKYANVVPSYSKSPMVQSIIGDTQAERKQVDNDIYTQQFLQNEQQKFSELYKGGPGDPQWEARSAGVADPMNSFWEAATGVVPGIRALNALSAVQIPYLGMSLGRAVNIGGGIHFGTQVPELQNKWKYVYDGKKDWRDAAVESVIPALEALGGVNELGNLALAAKARYSAIPQELGATDATGMIDLSRSADIASQQIKQPIWLKSKDVSENLGLFKPGRYTEDVAFAQKREIAKVESALDPKQYVSLKGTMVGDKPAYYFSANMPSSVEAGRALNALAAEIPKGGMIVEPNSLSTDSFMALFKRGTDSKKFTAFPGDYVVLNNSAVHNILPNQSKALQLDSPVMSFGNIDDAKEAAAFINSKLPRKFKTLKTKVVSNKYGEGYQIEVPTLKLRKEYKQGGMLKDTYWFL